MKKVILLVLTMVCAVLVSGCGSAHSEYYTIDHFYIKEEGDQFREAFDQMVVDTYRWYQSIEGSDGVYIIHYDHYDKELMEEWQRSTAAQQEKEKKLRPLALVLAVVGLGLVLAAVLVLMKQGEGGLTLPLLAPPLLGAVCLFLGGLWLIRRKKRKAADEIKREFHVNPAAIYRALQGVLMTADKDLKEAAELARLEKQREESAASALSTDETELFAGLLEAAYARRGASDGADAEEIIANIRYYLYKRNVETLDYSGEKAAWFECLPARRSGTIRPALVSGGRLLKKGLASAKEG